MRYLLFVWSLLLLAIGVATIAALVVNGMSPTVGSLVGLACGFLGVMHMQSLYEKRRRG